MPKQKSGTDYLAAVGALTAQLEQVGLTPILVGGMALVILGSRRVTRDFDFLVSLPVDEVPDVMTLFYAAGFALASQVDQHGDIVQTIDNPRVAAIRFRIDKPASCYFLNRATGLRIDLLIDFPLPAAAILANAQKVKVRSHTFLVAAPADLLALKKIAYRNRQSASDRQDIAFLEVQLKSDS